MPWGEKRMLNGRSETCAGGRGVVLLIGPMEVQAVRVVKLVVCEVIESGKEEVDRTERRENMPGDGGVSGRMSGLSCCILELDRILGR